MGFLNSYKHLEKLCGEVLNDDRRISAYIDEMTNTPRGAYIVSGWNDDLRQLKHYRWVRNQIAHEPDCMEQNMCEPGDAAWLDNFYSRIMNQTDPLALYAKAVKPRPRAKPAQTPKAETPVPYPQQTSNQEKSSQKTAGWIALFLVAALAVATVLLFFKYIS